MGSDVGSAVGSSVECTEQIDSSSTMRERVRCDISDPIESDHKMTPHIL